MKLTKSEKKVLKAIHHNYYHGNDSIVRDPIWSDSINDSSFPSGIKGKELSGTVSSLKKKGIVDINNDGKDSTIWITELGYNISKDL